MPLVRDPSDHGNHSWCEITKLIDSGVLRPIVDRTYPFDQAPQALAHVETAGQGKVVITMV